jgi:NAD(P)H-dependent FMN reductase
MPTLTVIIGSTRPGRAGLPIAEWFIARARAHGVFDVQVADLAEIDLPLLDEPNHPRLRHYLHQHTRDWSEIVDAADAFVIVTPEYNYGYSAAVKNAIGQHSLPFAVHRRGGTGAGQRSHGTGRRRHAR